MNVLFEAIYDKFDLDAALKAAVTDLYNSNAPQDTDFPYIVFFLITDDPQWTFNTEMEDTEIQFNIYDENPSVENVGDIFELLKNCFDDAVLTITGYTNIIMQRKIASLDKTPEDAWQYVVTYRVFIQKD